MSNSSVDWEDTCRRLLVQNRELRQEIIDRRAEPSIALRSAVETNHAETTRALSLIDEELVALKLDVAHLSHIIRER